MSKRTPKVLTPEQMEEIRTKDFFDMILPGTVKFLSDHYIVGELYKDLSRLCNHNRQSNFEISSVVW